MNRDHDCDHQLRSRMVHELDELANQLVANQEKAVSIERKIRRAVRATETGMGHLFPDDDTGHERLAMIQHLTGVNATITALAHAYADNNDSFMRTRAKIEKYIDLDLLNRREVEDRFHTTPCSISVQRARMEEYRYQRELVTQHQASLFREISRLVIETRANVQPDHPERNFAYELTNLTNAVEELQQTLTRISARLDESGPPRHIEEEHRPLPIPTDHPSREPTTDRSRSPSTNPSSRSSPSRFRERHERRRSPSHQRSPHRRPHSRSPSCRRQSPRPPRFCSPRRERRGAPIRRVVPVGYDEPGMLIRCVFCCHRHHSNSCGTVTDADDRLRIAYDRRFCVKCLGPHTPLECRRSGRCSYCRGQGWDTTDHNTAFCDRPRTLRDNE